MLTIFYINTILNNKYHTIYILCGDVMYKVVEFPSIGKMISINHISGKDNIVNMFADLQI